MAETSPIVTLLAQRPEEELEAMRQKAEESLTTLQAELEWIQRALATKKPKRRARRTSKRGDTKKRVLDFMKATPDPVRPTQVRDGLNATGPTVGDSAIYNTFNRLRESGEIERVEEGLYRLAARNGHRADEIGGSGSLLTATSPHEGQT